MNLTKLTKKQIILLVIAAVGVVLMLLPSADGNGAYEDTNEALVLENKIANLIEDTYDVADVSVILTYDTNGEKITANGINDSNDKLFNNNNTPFVISEKLPYVRGVLISAKSITYEDSTQIRQAVATLLGINQSKVNVIYSD